MLDDYTPLRHVNAELLANEAHLFTPRTAKLYVERDVAGGSQGTDYFAAPNPPFGATFTYYLRESPTTLKQARKEREKEAGENDVPFPGWDALEAERNEVADKVYVIVRDESGQVVGRVAGSTSKGMHRVTWNLRYPSHCRNHTGFLRWRIWPGRLPRYPRQLYCRVGTCP